MRLTYLISASTNPYYNLAVEEVLVRHADVDSAAVLFVYQNAPCVVVGRNQSVFAETNLAFCKANDIAICRRVSGGGTVYHDLGNWNISMVTKRSLKKVNNYEWFFRPLQNGLAKKGIEAYLNTRNSLLWKEKKISGTAQFTERVRMLTHATLLVSSNHEHLRKALNVHDFKTQTRALPSVPHPITTIGQTLGLHSTSISKWIAECYKPVEEKTLTADEKGAIQQIQQRMESIAWIYEKSPKTTLFFASGHQAVIEKNRWQAHPQKAWFKKPAHEIIADGLYLD